MEGLGRGLVRRGEGFVRGTEAGLDRAAKAARRGLEVADNAAHVIGIHRIPLLRQYLWGQVHTGFWTSYEVGPSNKLPQPELCARYGGREGRDGA